MPRTIRPLTTVPAHLKGATVNPRVEYLKNLANLTYPDYFHRVYNTPYASTSINLFTRKEFIVMRLIREGISVKDIAKVYNQSPKSLTGMLSVIASKSQYEINKEWI